MKKYLGILSALIFISAYSYGQTVNDVVCAFTKNVNGKVFTKKDDGSRFVNFTITGIKSNDQAEILTENVRKTSTVLEFTISDEAANNERNAYIHIKQGTKITAMWDVLLTNGINYIKLDDKIFLVSDKKLRAEKRQQKMLNNKTP